jgi:hypothetical protein
VGLSRGRKATDEEQVLGNEEQVLGKEEKLGELVNKFKTKDQADMYSLNHRGNCRFHGHRVR